ncbi:hypothetical protein F4677DRAFT_311926 [Hypoxylon crocopeplum]|nr:hypothetical protein F4677DRAFT_311926 [Hypoxylon crocopeplum]
MLLPVRRWQQLTLSISVIVELDCIASLRTHILEKYVGTRSRMTLERTPHTIKVAISCQHLPKLPSLRLLSSMWTSKCSFTQGESRVYSRRDIAGVGCSSNHISRNGPRRDTFRLSSLGSDLSASISWKVAGWWRLSTKAETGLRHISSQDSGAAAQGVRIGERHSGLRNPLALRFLLQPPSINRSSNGSRRNSYRNNQNLLDRRSRFLGTENLRRFSAVAVQSGSSLS